MSESTKVFISYRRVDSIETVGRIYDWLDSHLQPHEVFMDVESMHAGVDFRLAVTEAIQLSGVLLAVIGVKWTDLLDDLGQRRIDNPNDLVRIEIETAMRSSVPIIPVLIQGALMPAAGSLPPSLAFLSYKNAVSVRPNPDFDRDMERLLKGIRAFVPNLLLASMPRSTTSSAAPGVASPKNIRTENKGGVFSVWFTLLSNHEVIYKPTGKIDNSLGDRRPQIEHGLYLDGGIIHSNMKAEWVIYFSRFQTQHDFYVDGVRCRFEVLKNGTQHFYVNGKEII